jgi:hypothetical protein
MSNMSRKADKYGNIHFISLYGTILSRLAYTNDNKFLELYNKIFGPIIVLEILKNINKIAPENLKAEINDQSTFNLNDTNNPLSKYEYSFKNEHFIAFNELNIPQNVNFITNEITGQPKTVINGTPPAPDTVKYISIGWSNYGEVYVVADKRMPQTIFVVFRGTYSAKTAALYSKLTSFVPLQVGCKSKERFLYGIFKPSVEVIHTILESMTYLATSFLEAKNPNSIKVFTCGHSLGGAMCTNFAYLWTGIRQTAPYNAVPYNIFSEKIICISLGSPRCVSTEIAQKFCNLVKQHKILYLRVTTRGDPVPELPLKYGYQHPCSTDPEMRAIVSEDCNATLTALGKISVNYDANLDCQNYKTGPYVPNPLSHTVYLNILFTNAVDIVNFLKGIGMSTEIAKAPSGNTGCRVIIGSTSGIKAGFFDLGQAQDPNFKKTQKIGGPVNEDVRMSRTVFNNLAQQINTSPKLEGNLSPMSGTFINPFANSSETMPRLSCVNANVSPSATGAPPLTGGKRHHTRRKHRKSKSRKQTKKSKKPRKTRKRKHRY